MSVKWEYYWRSNTLSTSRRLYIHNYIYIHIYIHIYIYMLWNAEKYEIISWGPSWVWLAIRAQELTLRVTSPLNLFKTGGSPHLNLIAHAHLWIYDNLCIPKLKTRLFKSIGRQQHCLGSAWQSLDCRGGDGVEIGPDRWIQMAESKDITSD